MKQVPLTAMLKSARDQFAVLALTKDGPIVMSLREQRTIHLRELGDVKQIIRYWWKEADVQLDPTGVQILRETIESWAAIGVHP